MATERATCPKTATKLQLIAKITLIKTATYTGRNKDLLNCVQLHQPEIKTENEKGANLPEVDMNSHKRKLMYCTPKHQTNSSSNTVKSLKAGNVLLINCAYNLPNLNKPTT